MNPSNENVRVVDETAARALCALLDGAAAKLIAFGVEPVAVAECPHKFNDAWYDDFWYAVRCGETVWEQSQFFEDRTPPLVRQRTAFEVDLPPQKIIQEGSTLQSTRIDDLRAILRDLELAGWRDAAERSLTPRRSLLGLAVYLGQPWLCFETPNDGDGDVFAWDANGLFRVGRIDRFDQSIDDPRILVFEDVAANNLSRLCYRAKSYFLPAVDNPDAAIRLGDAVELAVAAVRLATNYPVALCSARSSKFAHDSANSRFAQPESFCVDLRPKEGELRRPTCGVWPSYQQALNTSKIEYSDLAKALHIALGELEDKKWREIFEAAFGETLHHGQTLALFVDAEMAVLMRDNSAFQLVEGKLVCIGAFDYPNCMQPGAVLFKVLERLTLQHP